MDPRLAIICDLFALWGLIYLVLGVVKKITHYVLSGVAVILLAGSMLLLNQPGFAGWILVGVATLLAVVALRMRFRELSGKR